MEALIDRDYFSDHVILKDPYAYFEALREKGPVYQLPGNGIVMVTGYEETLAIIKNTADFSSVLAPQGPAAPLPFTPEGSDITPQIEAHRGDFVGGDLLVSLDDRPHTFSRSLLQRLFTPSRLKGSEIFIAELSDQLIGEAVAAGGCELIKQIATPFVTLVIADLLGVPADDRDVFMKVIEEGAPPGSLDSDDLLIQNRPLVVMGQFFIGYVMDRRENPRDDVLSELANATYPDGSMPDPMEIVRLGTFLFGAGQDTSAKLLGNALRFMITQPGLQDRLRADPSLIPAFLEEVLRLEGSSKMTARVARRDTMIGDLPVPAGTKVMLALAAANRDPRRWTEPQDFLLDRPRIREHVAFGRGAHVCAGAPLARVEIRVVLEKLLADTSEIALDESQHADARDLDYEASFIIRGLSAMHLKLTPAPGFSYTPAPRAQSQPASDAPAAVAPAGYSTSSTKVAALLGDAAARALLDRHFPGVSDDKRIGMAGAMTLRSIQKFAPDMFTGEALDALDRDLARLPAQP